MTTASLAAMFDAAMAHCLSRGAGWPGAVAVSGGGDSQALLLLLAAWAQNGARQLPTVLTVDHGLAKGSARVANHVIRDARRLGLKAHKLVWSDHKPKSDVEAEAREARYRLMGDWCRKHGMKALYVAHTLEDQAETFLLRLARGSGLDGLSAMQPRSPYPIRGYPGLSVVRPLLTISRDRLRAWLIGRGESWSEDPMNADPRFARVRLRQAWPQLRALGLLPERIAAAAGHLARARDALEDGTAEFLSAACRFEDGRIFIDGSQLVAAPPEIGLRALAHLLSRLSGEPYRPRFERLERLYRSICDDDFKSARTLHGCRIARAPKAAAAFGPFTLLVTRERERRPVAVRKQIS